MSIPWCFWNFRFLRKRHRHLLKLQSPKGKAEFVQQQNTDIGIQLLANEIDNNVNEAVLKHPSPVLAMTPISVANLGTVLKIRILTNMFFILFELYAC